MDLNVNRCWMIAAWLVLALGVPAWAEEGRFPFVVSYDAPSNATSVAGWLPRPAGGQGFVRVEKGRLRTDAGPIRFWATNLCFEACFPAHEQAERMAARLARLGINCVRMHHIDSRHIWGKSPNKLTIDPERLERLDYLIAQLKRHGVYTNLNLHVSRWFGPEEGFAAREGRPNYDKGLDNFEPRMIELQRRYARDLLAHVNPYTGKAYTAEPAVAFVEINNENSIFSIWQAGGLDDLPEPYATTYRKLWNDWLRRKYGTTAALAKAWNVGRRPLGAELLRDLALANPPEKSWHMERDELVKARWTTEAAGPEGRRAMRLVVERAGRVKWHPQLTQGGFAVRKNEPYTLELWARADAPRRLTANCMMAHQPWQNLGLSVPMALQTEWRRFRFTFVAPADDPQARISLNGFVPGTYELAGVSLRPGGVFGLEDDQRLEDDRVPVLLGRPSATEAARRDFVDCLWEAERDYWWGMQRFLKEELKLRSLVSGTQLSYSPLHVQAGLDYIDAHSYWQHPHFPRRPWDSKDWTVRNIALVNHPGGTLASLACRRVAGMAYTVSEYNHPAPLEFSGEGFPMIAAFAGFQSWDGVFSFTYSHSDRVEPGRIEGFFDIKSDPAKLVHSPACAALFLRGDVAPARTVVMVPISKEAERAKLYETLSAWKLTADQFGFDPLQSLVHAVAIQHRTSGPGAAASPPPSESPAQLSLVSDTGQIRWDTSRAGAGYFTVDTPRSKLFTGFVAGRRFKLGEVSLGIGRTERDWATLSMVALDGEGFSQPGRILVAASGMVANRGAKLEALGEDLVTLGNQWGTEPVECEGVPAEIVLPAAPDRLTLYALDQSGNRRAPLAVGEKDGKAVLRLGPENRTLWYEAVVK